MKFSDLRDLKRSAYDTAADGWRKVSHQADADMDLIDQQMVATIRAQKGNTADAAYGALTKLSRNYQYVHEQCGLVETALNGLYRELEGPKKALKAALSDAEDHGLTVHDDGSVSYPAAESHGKQFPGGTAHSGAHKESKGLADTLHDSNQSAADALAQQADNAYDRAGKPRVNPKRHLAEQVAEDIAAAVRDAAEIDGRYSRALAKLKTKPGLTVTDAMWLDNESDRKRVHKAVAENYPKGDIPKDKSPKENAKWWKGLSKEEQDAYASLYPASVGGLDGIPAEARDTANRISLREDYAETKMKLAELMAKEPKDGRPHVVQHKEAVNISSNDWKEWNAKRKELEGRLHGMETIQNRFNRTGKDGLPEAYLLGFDSENKGRAIIANGNPDTADHTAVYVPGTTARLSKVDGDINRMTTLWQKSDAMAPGQNTSTITWLGYDAPQDILKDATRSHYANDGAPAFNKFVDGLNTSNHSGSDNHLTAIGHSYGSTLIGSAARQGHLGADDVVFAGSPGVQVGKAEDLDVPKGHVWNEEADGDKVPDLGRWFHGGSQWRIGGGTAIIPSDDLFGAHQMDTDTEGHSGYWDVQKNGEPSLSLKNQAMVMLGDYDRVKLGEH